MLVTSRPTAWREPAHLAGHSSSRVGHAPSCGEPQPQWEHRCRDGPNQLDPLSGTGSMGHHPRTVAGPLCGHTCGGLAPQTRHAAPWQHLVWRGRLPLGHTRSQPALSGFAAARVGAHRGMALTSLRPGHPSFSSRHDLHATGLVLVNGTRERLKTRSISKH